MYFNFSYNVVYVVSERDNCPIFFRHVKFQFCEIFFICNPCMFDLILCLCL
uniref:Uncharacterized protein n=1 Tax=Anguilla anguilla TaxID=7936 RepID=A0A0E9TNS9_ANGAN